MFKVIELIDLVWRYPYEFHSCPHGPWAKTAHAFCHAAESVTSFGRNNDPWEPCLECAKATPPPKPKTEPAAPVSGKPSGPLSPAGSALAVSSPAQTAENPVYSTLQGEQRFARHSNVAVTAAHYAERVARRLDRMFDALESVAKKLDDQTKFAEFVANLVQVDTATGKRNAVGDLIVRFKEIRDEFALIQHFCPDYFARPGDHQRWKRHVVRYDALLWDVFAPDSGI